MVASGFLTFAAHGRGPYPGRLRPPTRQTEAVPGAAGTSRQALISGTGPPRIQASLGLKTKKRRKKKLTVEAATVETALATLPLSHGERPV